MSDTKTYTVSTPNTQYTGVRSGVAFQNGKAEVPKEKALELIHKYGYKCPELVPEASDEDVLEYPSKNSTNDYIRAFMDKVGCEYDGDDKKAVLLEKLDAFTKA